MKKMKAQILFVAVLLGNVVFMQGMMSRSARQLTRPGVRSISSSERERLISDEPDVFPSQFYTKEELEKFGKLKVGLVEDPYWKQERERKQQEIEQEKLSSIDEGNKEPQEESWISRFFKYIFGKKQSQESQEESERDKQNRE